jgi:nucleoside-diphosphate-sugar epimerase
MTAQPTVLVIGPHGVTGGAVTRRLAADRDWRVITASRRTDRGAPDTEHLSVDLLEPSAPVDPARLRRVTHVVYAAYTERATMAAATAPNVAMLARILDGLEAADAPVQHVVLIGGGKSYGEHLGPYKTPAKESDPRLLGHIFYNEQEDLLSARADRKGFTFTVLRPDVVIGFGLWSPMNLLGAIGVYAALSKAAGVPLRFPGSPGTWVALYQFTDADLLAAAVQWALTAVTARDQVFNVLNGDQFRWQHLWPEIAAVFDMPTAPPQPMKLGEQMAHKEPEWDALVARHGLRPTPYEGIAAWDFADGLWASDYDMVQSTIKIRQAGFGGCVDSHESLIGKLRRLRHDRYLP